MSNKTEDEVREERLIERIAQITAHRVCIGIEHNPQEGKLHGHCVVCGIPFPCEYAGKLPQSHLGESKNPEHREVEVEEIVKVMEKASYSFGYAEQKRNFATTLSKEFEIKRRDDVQR